MTWSSRSTDSKLSTSGGYPCCSRITAALSAASRQCALPSRTTPRKPRSVSPACSSLYGRSFRNRCTAAGVRSRSTIRHSFVVNAARGGASTAPARIPDLRDQRRWLPFAAAQHGHQPAVAVDHGGAQVVNQLGRLLVLAYDRDAELRGERLDLLPRAGEQGPHRGIGLQPAAVAQENRGRVVFGIERHRHQVDAALEV